MYFQTNIFTFFLSSHQQKKHKNNSSNLNQIKKQEEGEDRQIEINSFYLYVGNFKVRVQCTSKKYKTFKTQKKHF